MKSLAISISVLTSLCIFHSGADDIESERLDQQNDKITFNRIELLLRSKAYIPEIEAYDRKNLLKDLKNYFMPMIYSAFTDLPDEALASIHQILSKPRTDDAQNKEFKLDEFSRKQKSQLHWWGHFNLCTEGGCMSLFIIKKNEYLANYHSIYKELRPRSHKSNFYIADVSEEDLGLVAYYEY